MSSSNNVFKQIYTGVAPTVIGSMLGYWKMDEGTGATVNDETANNRDLTVNGNPTWVTGFSGYGGDYALDLDGTGDYLSLADDNAWSFGNGTTDSAFSICGVFKLQALSTNTAFFSKYDVASTLREYGIFFDTDGRIRFRIYDESTDGYLERRTEEVLDLNKWYFIACTYTGTAVATNLKIYLNAIQIDNVTSSSGAYTAMENSTTQPLIGAYVNTGPSTDCINGIVDWVAVHNAALSASDILSIYNNIRPKSNNFMLENIWQCVLDETIDKAITMYNFPVPLLGNTDGGYRLEIEHINGLASGCNFTWLINFASAVTNVSYYYQIGASIAGAYQATYTVSATVTNTLASANNFCYTTIDIPFSAANYERFCRIILSKASADTNKVHTYETQNRITTPATATEITSMGFRASQVGGIGVGTKFRLYKLKGFS